MLSYVTKVGIYACNVKLCNKQEFTLAMLSYVAKVGIYAYNVKLSSQGRNLRLQY